jgi:RimJ/RimL family protein N-acetyltransferase
MTERLLLRRWRQQDIPAFAAVNADAEVMEHFPSLLTRDESEALARRIEESFERDGFGLWAVEVPSITPFIGFVGLSRVGAALPFAPAVEVGWRLDRRWWGQGLATEAAGAALSFGFDEVNLSEIVSFTSRDNVRSRRVMERLHMLHAIEDDFDHPAIAVNDPTRPHVLYRLGAEEWKADAPHSSPA